MTKPDCSNFVNYQYFEKPTLPSKFKKLISYKGLNAGKRNIYEWENYNKFKNTITHVPTHAKKVKIPKDIVNELYCGNLIQLVEDKSKLVKYKGVKYYFIHDNSGRPFIVYIKNNNYVDVLRVPDNMYVSDYSMLNKNHYTQKLASFRPLQVFIGKSPKNPMTEYSGGYGKRFDGNTILVKTGKNKYVFIGECIYSFTSLSEIVEYSSPVGNNDVPYPFAFDKNGNYYLFTEYIILLNTVSESIKSDPYDHYYNNKIRKSHMTKLKAKIIVKRLGW